MMENLEHLPDDRREALIMRFALGMDNREIARALGRTDGATKVLIHRAIKQLQEEMGDEAMTDVERLLADALRPIEPPERLSGRVEDTLGGDHPGGGRGALRLGRRALRERAARPARPAQLGPAGGRGRRRRRRHRRPGPARDAPPRPQQAKGGLRSLDRAGSGPSRRPLRGPRSRRSAGVASAAPTPSRPRIRWRKLSSVLTGMKPRIDVAAAEMKPQMAIAR